LNIAFGYFLNHQKEIHNLDYLRDYLEKKIEKNYLNWLLTLIEIGF